MSVAAAPTAAPAPAASPSASAPSKAPAEGEKGSRSNPDRIRATGGKARSDSRAAAIAEFSPENLRQIAADTRAGKTERGTGVRDEKGRFVPRAKAAAEGEQPAPEAAKPEQTAEAPAAEQEPAKADAKADSKPDAKVQELEAKVTAAATQIERFRQGSAEAAEKIADLTEDVEHWRGLFEGVRGLLRSLGKDVDPLALEKVELEHKIKRMERGGRKRQEAEQRQQVDQMTTALVSRARAVVAKHPELDPAKSAEARAWWESYWRGDVARMEDDAAAAAIVFRGRQIAKHQAERKAAEPERPAPTARPEADMPVGGPGVSNAKPPSIRERLSDDFIKREFAQLRAVRGGRS